MSPSRIDSRARPEDVAVTIGADGATARILPPHAAGSDMGVQDLRLSTALFVAGSLAECLGTQVCLLDESDNFYLIDDDPSGTGRS